MTPYNEKLYVISRKDLSPGAQAAQGMHALCEFAQEWPQEYHTWRKFNTLIFLAAENENALQKFAEKAIKKGLSISYFREPDFDNALTAIIIQPSALTEYICRDLHLALCITNPI